MRISAGRFKGSELHTPAGLDTRPPLEMVRQGIFNSLYPSPQGERVLDVFAGSGSLGLEALSRGAVTCDFIENNSRACKSLLQNLEKLGLGEPEARLLRGAFPAVLDRCAQEYDLILCDPPFDQLQLGVFPEIEQTLCARLSPSGIMMIRIPVMMQVQDTLEAHEVQRQKEHGISRVLFYAAKKS